MELHHCTHWINDASNSAILIDHLFQMKINILKYIEIFSLCSENHHQFNDSSNLMKWRQEPNGMNMFSMSIDGALCIITMNADKPVFRVLSLSMAKKRRYTQHILTYHRTHTRALTHGAYRIEADSILCCESCALERYALMSERTAATVVVLVIARSLAGNGAKRSTYVYASCEWNTYNVKRSVHDTIFCMFFFTSSSSCVFVFLPLCLNVLLYSFIYIHIYIA